ncbi:MAG TPA: hypothetical protein VFA96_07085 [Nocardioides sp.]|nr:hypothetical protein [Nocardioides sp.]
MTANGVTGGDPNKVGTTGGTITGTLDLAASSNPLQIPHGAQAGYVWTDTDGSGNGAWQPASGGGAGTVVSVNHVSPDGAGNITLTAANVGADATGAAAAAQSAAISAAEANAASTYLPLTGGALSGPLAMGNHKVTGVANGTVATDVAALGQVPVVGAAGSGAGNALSANDATTTNARTPTAHASTHATGGSDVLTPAAIGAVATSAAGAANGVATLDSSGHLTASQAANLVAKTSPVNLTDGATIATDASLSTLFRVTLGGNRTLSNPTNGTDGQLITWSVKQDATGSRTLTLDTKFRFGSDITSITLTTTPGKTDHIGARYNSADDKWDVIAFVRGF